MKKFAYVLVIMAAICGCRDKKTLYLYNWMDYIDPEAVAGFERENSCKVVIDGFDDNEQAISKLLVGGSGYDIVFPSSYVVRTMAGNGLIDKIDMSRLPNVRKNFDKKYARHLLTTNMEWSVPYAFSMTGYAYRSDKVPSNVVMRSWNCITNRCFNGRVCMLNDMREMLGIGLILNGHSVNSVSEEELRESAMTIKRMRHFAKKLDNVQYKSGLVSGEFYIGMGYNSDVLQVIQENEGSNVRFFVPDEGSTCCFDEMVIMKGSKNTDLAYRFIDYMYRPDVAAANAVYICTAVPNKGMMELISESDRNLIDVSEDVLSRLELIRDVGDGLRLYNAAWDTVRSNR